MPLTTIATPRKCLDLESGVCSGAPLLGAGLVGVLAAGPARLALVPIAGGDGKVADLAIAQVLELALLSRDVAVVRDADHALWTITDPFGNLRVKQIARDVRSLAMRPWGETAVALHLDGSATALTLNRQEVGARHLTVRGALRACDVGESVTFVVLDGEGGGQLRIHPGATPELGTSARTALPREAAELDRLRGGTAVSALFKRGTQTMCVITGSPSKLAAKLVQLDGKPADVAVLEDVVVVTFVDGRVALYDAGALERAGDAPMTPTSVVTLASRGKPRIVLATAKGSPALWIGTTAGELLCAPLVREAVAAEVVERPIEVATPAEAPRVVAPEPGPDVALAAELAATREALSDTALAREAAEERARTLAEAGEETQRAQAAALEERAQLVTSHAAAIDELKAESAVALAATAEARDRASAEQEAAWSAKRAELESALQGATAERDAARADLEVARAAAAAADTVEQARIAAAADERAQLVATHAAAVDALKAGSAAALAATVEARDRASAEQDAAWSAKRAELEAALQGATAERDAARADLEAARAVAAAAETVEQARIAAAAEERAQLVVTHAAAIEAAHTEGAQTLEAQSAAQAQTLEAQKAAHAEALEAQNAAHAQALEAQSATHAQALEAQSATHAQTLAAQGAAAAVALEDASRAARETLDARERDLDSARAELEAIRHRLADAEIGKAALGAELDAAMAARNAARADLAARTSERDALRAGVARVERELAEEREKLAKDSLKWGDRRISLEGARETVDSVLTQAKNVFLKRPRE